MTIAASFPTLVTRTLTQSVDAAQLTVEDLLGLMAMTTFLVGFASLRLQSELHEWRSVGTRTLDRLISENDQENLLPLPTSLQISSNRDSDFKLGPIPKFSLILACSFFASSLWLTVDTFQFHSRSRWGELGVCSPQNYCTIHLLHFLIIALLLGEILWIRKQARSEQDESVGELYRELERAVETWRKRPTKDTRDELDNVLKSLWRKLPGWSWLSLIDLHLNPYDFNRKQDVLRIQYLADRPDLKLDTYSLIALVWSTYLVEHSHTLESQRANESAIRASVPRGYNQLGEKLNLDEMIKKQIKDSEERWIQPYSAPPPIDVPAWKKVSFRMIERISEVSSASRQSDYFSAETSETRDFGDAMANLAIDSWIRCLNLEISGVERLPNELRKIISIPNLCVGGLGSKAVLFSFSKSKERFNLHGYHVVDADLLEILQNTDTTEPHRVQPSSGTEQSVSEVLKIALSKQVLHRSERSSGKRAETSFLYNLQRNGLSSFVMMNAIQSTHTERVNWLDLWRHVKGVENRPLLRTQRASVNDLSQWMIYQLQVEALNTPADSA